jgi:hypothetical protein
MPMDRSFLAFRQFLLRIIAGADAAKPSPSPVRHTPREPQAELRDDWPRIEL